jgi:hypothetical protein
MDPGVTSVALFFALVLFAVALVLPFIGVVGDWGASAALGVGFALLGALFVWLAAVAQ